MIMLQRNLRTACVFCTVGTVVHSSLLSGENSRQISVSPADLTWSRVVGVVARLYGVSKIRFTTSRGGLVFSTSARDQANVLPPGHSIPHSIRNATLPWHQNGMDMVDFYNPFTLTEFSQSPSTTELVVSYWQSTRLCPVFMPNLPKMLPYSSPSVSVLIANTKTQAYPKTKLTPVYASMCRV